MHKSYVEKRHDFMNFQMPVKAIKVVHSLWVTLPVHRTVQSLGNAGKLTANRTLFLTE